MSEYTEKAGNAGRAIITFSRGCQTLVATRSLGQRGVKVITPDEYAMKAASFSRYCLVEFSYPNPMKEPEAFLDILEKAVHEQKPKDEEAPYVLMPIHKETHLVAHHREHATCLSGQMSADIIVRGKSHKLGKHMGRKSNGKKNTGVSTGSISKSAIQ